MPAAQGYIGRNPADSSTVIARQSFSPTGIQTDFTFAAGYSVGYVDLYLNGSRLVEGQDFTATDGLTVGLTTNAVNGDVLEVVAFKAFNATNVTTAAGNFTVGGTLNVTGASTLSGNTTVGTGITLDTNGNVNVSGVLTANSFVGDGTQLTGVGGGSVISGITIREEGSVVGTSGTVVNVNFVGADVTATAQAGFSTITIAGGGKFINFTDGGSTGITTTAKTKIDDDFNVTGVGTFASRVSVGDSIFHVGDDNTAIGFPAADTFTVYTAGGERVRVDDSGRIIGGHTSTVGTLYKTTYQAKGVGSDHSAGYSVISGNDELAGAIVLDASASNGIRIDSDPDNARADSYLRFRVDASEALRITSAGRIGIGTAEPDRLLVVAGSDPIIRSEDTDAGNTYAEFKQISGSLFIDSRSNTSDGTIIFRGVGGGSATEKLRIRSTGPHLLLGTGGDASYNEITETSSNAGLVIGSSSVSNGGIVIRTGNTGTGRIYFADNSGSDAGRNVGNIRYQHADNTLRMSSGGSEAVVIDAGGNFNITGIATATQFDATSDVALKENIEVIDEPINKLSELKGVTFDWKAGGHSVGVIAQDVEKVLPTAVGGNKDQKTVNYNAIIGLLVESVKDQQKQIEELKSLLDK